MEKYFYAEKLLVILQGVDFLDSFELQFVENMQYQHKIRGNGVTIKKTTWP